MTKTLVIVESPGKIKTINSYLGKDYIVKASFGHIQDLDKKTLSIDVENNFTPLYITSPDKSKVVKELKELAKECNEVILATDEDREGEAIASSLRNVLKLKDPKRIVFHEITKKAISDAIESPRKLDENLINAQQARRLLDRLMGYKISPILWAYKAGSGAASAGRVQSVVLRILIDKEKEISNAISEPFLKTTGEFSINENKFNGTLNHEFKNEEDAINFLKSISKNSIFKVVEVENKKSLRKPSPPFITSTLQQDASTKMGFPVKRTMEIAQKLYEAGMITYMRTDSTNLSDDCLKGCQNYICTNYGKEYYDKKIYTSKSKGAQEAHEAIRPTHLEITQLDGMDSDCQKLYSLIWKRTMASQMANAKINVQNISIDIIEDKKSLLIFGKKQSYFISTFESVEFDGFLKLYDNTSEDDETVKGKLEIKVGDIIKMSKLKTNEEYTKLPLRYNEAGLIKFLEKNGIGRPSTYQSIISKIIDKNYVEIKNIDGIEKESKNIELSNALKIKQLTKKIRVGKENKKMVPTDTGGQIVEFLMKHFEPIMEVKFTADFEEYLDKIAEGKAKWVNVLNQFYQIFNPICEKLSKEAIKNPTVANKDRNIGTDPATGLDLFYGEGEYGPYVKRYESKNSQKWRYVSINEDNFENYEKIVNEDELDDGDIDIISNLFEYPKEIGKIGKSLVMLNKGKYGLYIKYGNKNYSVKDKKEDEIDLNYVKSLVENGGDKFALKSFKVKNKVINVKSGQYGPYLQIVSGTSKSNLPIPKSYDVDELTLADVLEIIADKNGTINTNQSKKK